MGYTASGGPGGLGVFNNSPSTVADLNKLVELMASVGNVRKGTATERGMLSGAQLFDGLVWSETDTGQLWMRVAGVWTMIASVPILVQATSTTASVNGTVLIVWSAPGLDLGGFFNSSQPTRLYAPRDGLYRMEYTVRTSGTNPITANPRVNGTALPFAVAAGSGVSGGASTASSSQIMRLSAGDFVDIQLVSTAAVSGAHQMSLQRIGA